MNETDIKLRIWELSEMIDELQWELANGAYRGCSDVTVSRIASQLADLTDEREELINT